ncbi:hypothetical protein NLG97_g4176 [Lecanicillium saksenae]|uniref:Uncharacterized protein n=1 Tax=Lecanicillium saksenae TaxID=468837 RepID=A0ACC1QZB1_9HYPO|nr:hypothetical protein NLG97_g4176 [Lecanicillium saksenae]
MTVSNTPLVSADNEWSPLKSVIVGRAEHSAFPSEPAHMISATMPQEHTENFRPFNPFPTSIVTKAQAELDNLAKILEGEGIRVYRPRVVDWLKVGGYTGAMPRDALMTVGTSVIESPFAWKCRRHEVELGYADILSDLSRGPGISRICRAPLVLGEDTLYDGLHESQQTHKATSGNGTNGNTWAINNSRPAFDTADFMRFGNTIIGQLSNVTNQRGVDYLRAVLPEGYTLEILSVTDEHAMHIDATLLPLRRGILVFNPERVTEEALRHHAVFEGWQLFAYPFVPQLRDKTRPPMYMCSPWLVLNALSIDEKRILIEENDTEFAAWLKDNFGMEPIMCPFQNVNSLGGSFHCATVDLVRSG